jgi:SAM-dependent methyltransferase
LSGRAVAVVPDEASASRARKGAADAGVLVEIELAPPTRLPLDNDAFDLAVVDDTGGLFGGMPPSDRALSVRELVRVLRPGGRLMIIGALPRAGFGALLSRTQNAPSLSAPDAGAALQADGFKSVRTLAEREGLIFVEGIKPR